MGRSGGKGQTGIPDWHPERGSGREELRHKALPEHFPVSQPWGRGAVTSPPDLPCPAGFAASGFLPNCWWPLSRRRPSPRPSTGVSPGAGDAGTQGARPMCFAQQAFVSVGHQ